MTSRFKTGSGAYTCNSCGKRTRETGEGESELQLCAACLDEAGLENEHWDYGHDEPVAGCPECPEATPTQKENDMPNTPNTIRDQREAKQLSQDKVAEAAGLTYSRFVRIEEGSGKTTPEEVAHVLDVLEGMEPGTRKLAGRPFKDPEKQAAVEKARASGRSVAKALGYNTPAPAKKSSKAPAKKATSKPSKAPAKKTTAKGKSDMAKALSKKTSAKKSS